MINVTLSYSSYGSFRTLAKVAGLDAAERCIYCGWICVKIALLFIFVIFPANAKPDEARRKVRDCMNLSGIAERSILPIVNTIALHGDLSDAPALTSAFAGKIDFKYGTFCCIAVATRMDDIKYVKYVSYRNDRNRDGSIEIKLVIDLEGLESAYGYCPPLTKNEMHEGLAGPNHDEEYWRVTSDGACDENCGSRIGHFLPKDRQGFGVDVIWSYVNTYDGIPAVYNITLRSVVNGENN